MPRRLLVVVILILSGVLVWLLLPWPAADRPSGPHRSPVRAELPSGGDFRLQSASGPVDLRDLRGQVVLLYFGYTSCPDVCPTNLAFIASALKSLTSEELARVQVLFVSVDPERDDLKRLATYAAYFHPRFLGLTGSPAEVATAARLYGATYRRAKAPDSAMGYTVDHSSFTYVIDPRGQLAGTLNHATPPERIAATIRELIAVDPTTSSRATPGRVIEPKSIAGD